MQRRRPLRWVARLTALLLAGAGINVGVAWWYAALTSKDLVPSTTGAEAAELLGSESRWPRPVPDNWLAPQVREHLLYPGSHDLLGWSHIWWLAHPHGNPPLDEPINCYTTVARFGWPARALKTIIVGEAWAVSLRDRSWKRTQGEIELPAWSLRLASALKRSEVIVWKIPTIPMWPGFAINTLFYAAPLGVVAFGSVAARRHLRRRRNLCPACAYQLTGEPICPECGTPSHRA
jgi:hypothetical protein